MAYTRSTSVDMMALSHDKYLEYNEQLYKKVLPAFKRHIPVDLMDEAVISEKLMTSEMEKIRKKEESDGPQAGAGFFLHKLHTKPDWFHCLIKAMKSDTCKLHDFIRVFEDIKDEVDKEWLKKHPKMYSGNTSVDMMALSHDKYLEYNERLYKKVLPAFKRHIPVDMMDEHVISEKLMTSEMEKIRKKEESEGRLAGAGLFLEKLHTKPDWFHRLIKAMKSDTCKLHDFIHVFEGIKDEVDREWLKKHPETRVLCSPRNELPRPVNAPPRTVPESNFDLSLQNARIQRDSDANTRLKTPIGTDQKTYDPPMAINESPDCDYVDGASAKSLQTDATPEIQKESRRPPFLEFTRQDHPGLKDALSFEPAKDFNRDFVREQLAGFPAFTDYEEEQQIIRLLHPHLHKVGSYVVWYWALAKRPTVCVVAEEGRFLTFVVHKSSKTPASYFINKRQMKCQSLKDIVQFHIENDIRYTRDKRTVNISLTTPVTSRSGRF